MDNEALKQSLLAIGLPVSVLHTTLPLEGQTSLREALVSRTTGGWTDRTGFMVYPSASSLSGKARTAFYTLAKECFLARKEVYVVSLSRMVDALVTDNYESTYRSMQAADMLFIVDFFEYGAPVPFSGVEGARLRAYIKNRIDAGKPVSLLSDKTLPSCKEWYPMSFLDLLSEHTTTYAIGKVGG